MSDQSVSQAGHGLGFVKGKSYLALPRDPTPWIIHKMLPQGGLLNLYGKPKAGKSFGALGMALAIADPAIEYWVDKDFVVMQHGPVMYLQCDTPRGEWVRRVEDILKVHPYDVDDVWWGDTLQTPYPFDILYPKHMEWLKASAERCKPVAVFVDTLREIHSGEEDSSTVMRNVIANPVSAVRPAALVLVSHTRKSNPNFEDDLMEGAQSLKNSPQREWAEAALVESPTQGIKRDIHGLFVDDFESWKGLHEFLSALPKNQGRYGLISLEGLLPFP